MRPHEGIQEDHARIRAPGSAEIDRVRSLVRGQRTVAENKAPGTVRTRAALRRDVPRPHAVDFAVIEDGASVAKDEIDGARDVAVIVQLAAGGSVKRVLPADQAAITQNRTVGMNRESDGLGAWPVRVLDGKGGTESKVRVLVEWTDHRRSWATVGISDNVIDASWRALVDALRLELMRLLEQDEPAKINVRDYSWAV